MAYVKNSNSRKISRVYVEEDAFEYEITKKVLSKYPDLDVVTIKNYKDVFNRSKQCFSLQKDYPQLILAVKKDNFIYEGSPMCQSFGCNKYYYATLMINCLFDCKYCFLQGMYNSAIIVAFVNVEDFIQEFKLLREGSLLALSYETDLIAHHNIVPYMDYLYSYFKETRGVIGEIRTKSANTVVLAEYEPIDNLILAYTLTPGDIISKHERFTPSLDARLMAVNRALELGYKVRVCFDPVFVDEVDYTEFFRYVFSKIDGESILDVGYGFFRMPKEQFVRASKESDSVLFAKDYEVIDETVTYSKKIVDEIAERHLSFIQEYVKREKIYIL